MQSERTSAAKKWRLAALAVALSLAVSACGADADPADQAATSPTLGGDSTSDDSTSTSTSTDSGADSAPSDESADSTGDAASAAASDTSGAPSSDAGNESAVAPMENLFPDLDVVNVADGSSVNLAAELGGGDKATLLWFWAPH